MKKIVFGLIGLFIVGQFLVSCSSENDILSQFSKRKYLKKYKAKNQNEKSNIDFIINDEITHAEEVQNNDLASTSVKKEVLVKEGSSEDQIENTSFVNTSSTKIVAKDYSVWNNYDRNLKFDGMSDMAYQGSLENRAANFSSNRASEVVIAILCFFLPPVGVILYEDTVTGNFWLDLVLTLLFWLPGMIYAFLVCFAGVSV